MTIAELVIGQGGHLPAGPMVICGLVFFSFLFLLYVFNGINSLSFK